MKKIYSIALLAMMAVCAMVFTSCGDDDDVPATDSDIVLSVSKTTSGGNEADLTTAVNEIANFYGSLVQNNKLGTYDSSSHHITIKSSAQEKVKTLMKNADTSSLKATIAKLSGVLSITCNVQQTNNTTNVFATFSYKIETNSMEYLAGTWTASEGGVEYKLVITNEEIESDGEKTNCYKATAYVDSKKIDGQFRRVEGYTQMAFLSDEKDADGDCVFALDQGHIVSYFLYFDIMNGSAIRTGVKFTKSK